MCEYIKDDGEQCGIEQEPFCHQHEDTRFAALWRRSQEADGRPDGIEMDASCSECDAPLRRTEGVREHDNFTDRLVFQAMVECDCSEHVLGVQHERKSNLPDGWS